MGYGCIIASVAVAKNLRDPHRICLIMPDFCLAKRGEIQAELRVSSRDFLFRPQPCLLMTVPMRGTSAWGGKAESPAGRLPPLSLSLVIASAIVRHLCCDHI